MKLVQRLLSILMAVSAAAFPCISGAGTAATPRHAEISGLPLNFEPAAGPGDGVEFLAHGPKYAIALGAQGAALAVGPDIIRLQVQGARAGVQPSAERPLPGVVNYIIGNDPSRWRTGVKTFGQVRYAGVYPGIDLMYYGTQGRLEYDFAVAPGASAAPIRLAFAGADAVQVDARGNLKVTSHGHEVVFERPVAYQMADGLRVPVAARYQLRSKTVRFQLGDYDHEKRLVIDPVLSYFSYLGGSGNDVVGEGCPSCDYLAGQAAAVDAAGDLYIAGYTDSTNFPTQSPFAPAPTKASGVRGPWAFVTKFAPDAKTLIFSTYLGGTLGADYGYGLALDSNGNAFVVGVTGSNDFPVTPGVYQTLCAPNFTNNTAGFSNCSGTNGQSSAWVSKFSPTGALLASTFLGGTQAGQASAVAVDSAGRPYVTGWTYPDANLPQVGGQTKQAGFPTTPGALQSQPTVTSTTGAYQDVPDAYVSVFNPTLTTLVYSTLFGDTQLINPNVTEYTGLTYGTAVAVDAAGNFYLAGYGQDGYLPTTAGAFLTSIGSATPSTTSCGVLYPNNGNILNGNCSFAAKFSPVGGANPPTEIYGTYLGHLPAAGGNFDQATGISADGSGDAYVVGYSNVATFPTTAGAYQTTCGLYTGQSGETDTECGSAFIAKINPTGTALLAATYVGGLNGGQNNISDNVEVIGPITLDTSGNVYIAGTAANNFPQVNGLGATLNSSGGVSPFVAELDANLSSLKFSTLFGNGNGGQQSVNGLSLDRAGNIYVAGSTNAITTSVATPGAFQSAFGGGTSDAFVAKIVLQTPTATTLSAAPSSATSGTAINLTATVAEVGGTSVPTGTVTFKDGTTTLGSLTLNGTGVAVYTIGTLSVGSHSITAVYGGDSANSASTSTAASVTVAAIPAPTVTISVAPTSIVLGKTATVTWSSTNATACTASGAWSGTEAVSGTATETPTAAGALSYVLTCTGSGGSASATAALTVTAPAPTVTIAVSPATITVGQATTLTWSSTNATSCTASGAWSGTQATSGTASESPTATGTSNFTLSCTGSGGSGNATAALTVNAAAKKGGGAVGWWELLSLAGFALYTYRRRQMALARAVGG
jgi:hypothetical protein